jgi:hypothetical protein
VRLEYYEDIPEPSGRGTWSLALSLRVAILIVR